MRSSRWSFAALAACLAGAANAAPQVTSVAADRTPDGVEVHVRGEALKRPRELRFMKGRLYALEFDAGFRGRGRTVQVDRAGLKSVRYGWRSARPMRVRVTFNLTPAAKPKLEATPEGWRVRLSSPALAVAAAPKKVAAKVPPKAIPRVEAFPERVPALEPLKPVAPKPIPAAAPPAVYRVTLDFVNTDVVQILKALALQSGVNVVTAPEVKGSLTVSLHDVTVEEALKLVTSLAGIDYAQVGSTYVVTTPEKMAAVRRQITGEAAPKPEVDVVEAYHVKGGKAADLVTAVAGKDQSRVGGVSMLATPAESASHQAIVMRGPAAEVKALGQVLGQLDGLEADQANFEIYEVKYSDPMALREDLLAAVPGLRASVVPNAVSQPRIFMPNSLLGQAAGVFGDLQRQPIGGAGGAGAGAGAGAAGAPGGMPLMQAAPGQDVRGDRDQRGLMQPFTTYEPGAVPMRLVLRGTPAQIALARAYAAKVDVAPRQVALELRVMELNREEAQRVGIDWSILYGAGTVRLLRVNQGLGDSASTPGTIGANIAGGSNVLATLDQISNRRNVIARPNLLAIDGRESELFVGDVVRFIKTIQATQNGTTVETGEERVGVRLAVLPRVGADGSISLDLRPVLSYLRGFTPVPGGGQLPQTSERVAQTTAVVRSGETIALGGLVLDQDVNQVSGIPLLKDLPIVGALFRRSVKTRDRSEIVFFLTVREVTEADRANAAAPPKG